MDDLVKDAYTRSRTPDQLQQPSWCCQCCRRVQHADSHAEPYAHCWRVVCTPGEINTLQGNLNWVASRQHELKHPIWAGREEALYPLCNPAASDSANLDNMAELLVRTGAEPAEALMLLVPEAYRNHPDLMKTYPEVSARCAYVRACVRVCVCVLSGTRAGQLDCRRRGDLWQAMQSVNNVCMCVCT